MPVGRAVNGAGGVKVTLPPAGRFTLSLMLPDPLAAQVPPPAPTQVQVAPVSEAGKVSVTVAPVASIGSSVGGRDRVRDRLAGCGRGLPSVLVIERSAIVGAAPPGTTKRVMLCPGTVAETVLPTSATFARCWIVVGAALSS